jgi:hypothetical protein
MEYILISVKQQLLRLQEIRQHFTHKISDVVEQEVKLITHGS